MTPKTTPGSRTHPPVLSLFAGVLLATIGAGCAGGSAPETGGIDPEVFRSRFSGQWVLDETVSEDPSEAVDPEAIRRGPGAGGGAPGIGIPTGGGDARGGGGNVQGGAGAPRPSAPDTEALQVTLDLFRTVPQRFSLRVEESTITTTWLGPDGRREGRMEIAGDGSSTDLGDRRIETRAAWEGRRLRIERRVSDGAVVVDRIEALGDGDRLLVTRTLEGLPMEIRPVRLAFEGSRGG